MTYDCRKKFPGDTGDVCRPLEYLCRGCQVIECDKCTFPAHTRSECSIVKLTDIGRSEIQKWSEELKLTAERLNFTTEWNEKAKQTGMTSNQRHIKQKCSKMGEVITLYFDKLLAIITDRRNELLSEAKQFGQMKVDQIQKCLDNRSFHANQLIEARKLSELFCQPDKLIEGRTDLIELFRAKTKTDQMWKFSLPYILKPIVEDKITPDAVQLDLSTEDFEQMITLISRFCRVRSVLSPGEIQIKSELPSTPPPPQIETANGQDEKTEVGEMEKELRQLVVESALLPTELPQLAVMKDETRDQHKPQEIVARKTKANKRSRSQVSSASEPKKMKTDQAESNISNHRIQRDRPQQLLEPNGDWYSGLIDRQYCAVCRTDQIDYDLIITCAKCQFRYHGACHIPQIKTKPSVGWLCGKCAPFDNPSQQRSKILCGKILLRLFCFSQFPTQFVGEVWNPNHLGNLNEIRMRFFHYKGNDLNLRSFGNIMREMLESQSKKVPLDSTQHSNGLRSWKEELLRWHHQFRQLCDQYFPGQWRSEFDLNLSHR